jgi:hypothetical protein
MKLVFLFCSLALLVAAFMSTDTIVSGSLGLLGIACLLVALIEMYNVEYR